MLNSTPGINSTSELPAALRASGIPSRVSWSVRAMALRFLEEARSRWMEELNIPMEKLENEGFTIPTLEVDCKYKHHVTSGDIIVIEPYISEFNGIRMTVKYNVTNKKTGDIVIDAFTKHCFTDRTLRPINMKKKNIEIYNIFESLYEENAN